MIIRNATINDLKNIIKIENIVEQYPASYDTLKKRINMFPEGFYVAEENREIIGYIESCIWYKDEFNSFEEIKEFEQHHNPNGDNLYVIFLATLPCYRNNGVGSKLLNILIEKGKILEKKRIQLVSKEGLESYYSKFGFEKTRFIPNYLGNSNGTLMEISF